MLVARLLRKLIRVGRLEVTDAGGRSHRFEGAQTGPQVAIRLHDHALHWQLFLHPELYVGEAYVDGRLTVENGDVHDLMDLLGRNYGKGEQTSPLSRALQSAEALVRRIHQYNPMHRARANVAHHYDLSGELYDLFLDDDRQYSCAYFPPGCTDLDEAQRLKKRHIAAKLCLQPGLGVLDIGSGWGGLALDLAGQHDVRVLGVTLSSEQLAVSRARAAESRLTGKLQFELQDYRQLEGRFDRIVSVGMFEHVGVGHYRDYFRTVRDRLTDDGIALLHTIIRMSPPGACNPWIRKYIFPGGYIPSLSEITAAVEHEDLWITDIEVWRGHYAETIRHWRERFADNRDHARALFDERFCRMWEFYLAASEASFRHMGNAVAQIQLTRRQDAVPLTRDYITDWERRQSARRGEPQSPQPSTPGDVRLRAG